MTRITFFTNAISKTAVPFTTDEALLMLQSDHLHTATQQYRLLEPGKVRDNAKKTQFPAVCWSVAKFTDDHRLAANCAKHSGLICIDIDKLTPEKYAALIKLIPNDPHTFICFTSPSGTGIKVVIKIESDAKKHLAYFHSIAERYLVQYGVVIDASGKDVSRLCFLCHDDGCFVNHDSTVYSIPVATLTDTAIVKAEPFKLNTQQQQNLRKNTGITYNDVFEFTQKIIEYTDGNRNRFVHLFACNCNRKGLDQFGCENFAYGFAADLDAKEVKATVNSAYQNNKHEYGKFAKKDKPVPSVYTGADNGNNGGKLYIDKKQSAGSDNKDQSGNSGAAGTQVAIKFWQTSINEKTNKESISLNYTQFYKFLENEGYANLKIDDKNVELIHIKDNIVTPVIMIKNRNDIRMNITEYCKEKNLYNVLEMLHRGQSKYFARDQFSIIGYKNIDFFKDEKDVAYHFHSNCVVESRADGITVRDYSSGEKSLWASQINPRPFTRVPIGLGFNMTDRIKAEDTICEFAQYQILASCHPNSNVTPDVANKRFLAHATSLGYLINNFKPVNGPAIVGSDHHKAMDRTEQNGRTGKGIFSKAIGHITKRFPVDGRKFDSRDQGVFEGITMDTKVITVDDCHAKFDFGYFFVPVTEDFSIRKMYVGEISIPYEVSPKWYFNTNFTFFGDGDSFSGRQHIIEFDNFFSKNYSPIDYFGHSLFREWTDEQWNLFYNYAYECDVLYKSLGLVKYAEGNYLERKLINECPQEFIDYVDATDETTGAWLTVVRNQWFDKKKFLEGWNVESRQHNMNLASSKQVYAMLKKYCKSKEIGFYSKKSNGTEIYWIGDRMPVPMKKGIIEVIACKNAQDGLPVVQKEMFVPIETQGNTNPF